MALLLQDDEVRSLLAMDQAIEAVEDAFRALARGEACNFPRQRSAAPGVAFNVLCSASQALDAAGVKCYPIVRRDVTVGSSFTMLVYRISTGALLAVMEANALGQIRTGAASAVAAKYMARPDSRVMALFGTGWQAESQLEALARVLPRLERVDVLGRNRERAERFCRTMSERLQLTVAVSADVERSVSEADVVTTVTGARQPLFDGRWLKAGVHVNAVGSNYPDKQEIDANTVHRAGRIVVDDVAVARSECGDLLAVSGLEWSTVHPLCSVVAGIVRGRESSGEITLFESHGLGLEDLAAACRVLERAQEAGAGMDVPLR
jgi:ornithine cyclodeaminase/alanine dehydrogenase